MLDTPFVRDLVASVREEIERSESAAEACDRIRPAFEAALARRDWLPAEFQRDVPDSGMGGGIGQWLLFRSADRSLCLFSLVVPAGSMTPDPRPPRVGARRSLPGQPGRGVLRPGDGTIALTRRRPLAPGDYYRPAPARRRHPSRAHDLGRDVGLDPPARERHRLHRPPHLRRAHRRGERLPLRLRERVCDSRDRQSERVRPRARARRHAHPTPPSTTRASRPARGQWKLELPLPVVAVGRARDGSSAPHCRARADPGPGGSRARSRRASTFCTRARCSSSVDVAPAAELRLVLAAPAAPPAGESVRVVGRGVEHRVAAPVDVGDPRNHVHPGQADRLAQRDHVGCDVPEVLDDQRQAAQPLAGGVEERDARSLAPRAVATGRARRAAAPRT